MIYIFSNYVPINHFQTFSNGDIKRIGICVTKCAIKWMFKFLKRVSNGMNDMI